MSSFLNGALRWDLVLGGAFVLLVLLVLLPTVLHAREFPDRLRDIQQGIRGILYTPVALAVFLPTLLVAYRVSRQVPILQWGWLGSNIIMAPLRRMSGPTGLGQPRPESTITLQQLSEAYQEDRIRRVIWDTSPERSLIEPLSMHFHGVSIGPIDPVVLVALFVALLLPVFILFNYNEEHEYRDSWRAVGIWAVSHLIMGIPLYAVFPIFAVGAVLKLIHDYRGLERAYVTHLTVNCIVLSIIVVVVAFNPAVIIIPQ
jgi:hypothetical protein